uniref:Uncharacterized protein n=1 Tax=Vespula pensylvanica TaxID=30213 RepID=A0A834K0L0_VESPE|nr:hypothetical protein H0235_016659 [Vespula pensylvanica]
MFGWTLLGTDYTDDTGDPISSGILAVTTTSVVAIGGSFPANSNALSDRNIQITVTRKLNVPKKNFLIVSHGSLNVLWVIVKFSVLVKGEDDGTLTHLNGPWENVCRSANEECSNVPGKIIVLRGKFGDLYSSLHPDGYE